MKRLALPAAALAVALLPCSPAAAQTAVRAGQTVSGTLDARDLRLGDDSFADDYVYRGRRGERLVVTLRSDAFDAYLAVGRGAGADFASLGTDDDGAGGTDSRVELELPADGEYVIRANSFGGGATGSYSLEVGGGGADGPVEPADGDTRVERGTLGPGDETLASGEYRDAYTVQGRRGERLVADLRSDDLDPYLIVVTPGGEQEENDDFEGDQRRSLVSLEMPEDGEYRIFATTYRPKAEGSYELRIGTGGARVAQGTQRRERGELASGDTRLKSGEYVDRYSVEVLPGQRLRVDLSSSDFDTYLMVKDPRGEQTDNDDADGHPGHAIVELTAAEGGTYDVMATSYRPGETGAYQLAIEVESAFASAARERSRAPGTLAPGGSVGGRLEEGDPTLQGTGEFSDTYVVEGRPGETLVVEMASGDFDTYLMVRTPEGESLDNDDHEGSSSRSRLEVPMRSTGRYRVVATSYRRGETGAYTVAASTRASASAGTLAGRGARGGDGTMGTGRGGRVHGVFVGVSDYGGRASDLSFTARDAVTMRDALVRGAGMRPEDAVVLTDREATVENVRAAIARVAPRVGPDDMFVFFHSGHGDRVPVRGEDDDDPDGLDETIEMFDAAIRDDELGEMLDAVGGGTAMVVIDACFSGGFSKDVINRPGRIGFFSSEEDVVSAVASKFRAGGYLPVFFSEAVGDHRGDREDAGLAPVPDRQLTLLELSQYLRERYGTEVKSSGMAGPGGGVARNELSYQHLVVDRGGVDAYSVMFKW